MYQWKKQKMKKYIFKWWFFLLLIFTGFILYLIFKPAPHLQKHDLVLKDSFEDFYQQKLELSKLKNARKDNQEKLIRHDAGVTDYAILYIHGFGASRAEGELVTDSLSSRLKANTYYLRLPGHGTNRDDHAESTFSEYIHEVEEALAMMPKLGKKQLLLVRVWEECSPPIWQQIILKK